MRRAGDSDERKDAKVCPESADMRDIPGCGTAAGLWRLYASVWSMGRSASGMDPRIDNVGCTKRPKGLFLMHIWPTAAHTVPEGGESMEKRIGIMRHMGDEAYVCCVCEFWTRLGWEVVCCSRRRKERKGAEIWCGSGRDCDVRLRFSGGRIWWRDLCRLHALSGERWGKLIKAAWHSGLLYISYIRYKGLAQTRYY